MKVININNINKLKYFDTLYHFNDQNSINSEKINSEDFKSFCIINMEDRENIILNCELSFHHENLSKRKFLTEKVLLNGNWYYLPKIY